MKITELERGIWFAIQTLANSYEENAVKILVQSANFNREKCLALEKETGLTFNGKTMEVVDWEIDCQKTIVVERS